MIQNRYLEQAIKDEVLKYLRFHHSIRAVKILDICKINEFGGTVKYSVLVKHKAIANKYCPTISKYNCTAFVIMSYSDWTLSIPDEIGTSLCLVDGFWNEVWNKNITLDGTIPR